MECWPTLLGRVACRCSGAPCRYVELQKLLGVENIEKAALLMQAAEYTRQLQVWGTSLSAPSSCATALSG